jgi:hypothetical protein
MDLPADLASKNRALLDEPELSWDEALAEVYDRK